MQDRARRRAKDPILYSNVRQIMHDSSLDDMPDIAYEYWSIYTFMNKYPGSYSMDDRRAAAHIALCDYYGISREQSLTVTDFLTNYSTAVEMHVALKAIKERYAKD